MNEMLTRKHNNFIKIAYFYIKHDDRKSQIFSNVLNSLISQLARQNSAALDDVIKLHMQHLRKRSLITNVEKEKLIEFLFRVSKHFMNIFIMIDELNECKSAFDRDRKRLINVLFNIHRNRVYQFHSLIFNRNELDINKNLIFTRFEIVFIIACSANLRLNVHT